MACLASSFGACAFGRRLGATLSVRRVTVWPQWPYDDDARPAKPVGDPQFRWPPKGAPEEPAPGAVMTQEEVKELRKKIYRKIWEDMAASDWSSWERRFWELKDRAVSYDEVAYTLLLHGYVLSHRHQAENAYLVLEEMKQAETHPALVRLNERLLNSNFELQELGMRGDASLWHNVLRLCFHCARRFQKKRQKRLQEELSALEPDEVLALEASNVRAWLSGHDRLALPDASGGKARRFGLPGKEMTRLPPEERRLLAPASATEPSRHLSAPRAARGRRSGAARRAREMEETWPTE
ncbi:unnamed protein product [Effrenium voratum]|nr:unnamed protein product [Effrenium voratum]